MPTSGWSTRFDRHFVWNFRIRHPFHLCILLRRQTERIPSHWMQHLEFTHQFVSRQNLGEIGLRRNFKTIVADDVDVALRIPCASTFWCHDDAGEQSIAERDNCPITRIEFDIIVHKTLRLVSRANRCMAFSLVSAPSSNRLFIAGAAFFSGYFDGAANTLICSSCAGICVASKSN